MLIVVVCAALLLVGVVLAVLWGGERLVPRTEDGVAAGAGFWRRHLGGARLALWWYGAHDPPPRRVPDTPTGRMPRTRDRRASRADLRLAAVAAEVQAQYGLGATVIPNGVDADRFARAAGAGSAVQRDVWRARFGRYVLAVGGIEPRKGSIDLLEAFARVQAQHPDVALVFCGGETLFDYREYRERFDRRAAELDIRPVVLGTLDHAAVPALVAAADVLSFVSMKEGFGLAAMEALAAGTPVVARDLPVLREVFGDAVRYASAVDDIAVELSAVLAGDRLDPDAGRVLARSFSWDAAAERHERFYSAVLGRGGDDGAPIDLTDLR